MYILVDRHVFPKKKGGGACERDMGKYITKSTVHALSGSNNSKISASHYVLGRFV